MKYKLPEYKKYIEQLNNETKEHSIRVAALCDKYAYTENVDRNKAYKVGLLHDIGKIFIPSRILKKDTSLTGLEREMIDLHSYYGYKILKEIGESKEIYLPVLFHHGFGKHRLTETDEPIDEYDIKMIRLIHSIDIYDALTNKRVYHGAEDCQKVFEILKKDVLCSDRLLNAMYENMSDK